MSNSRKFYFKICTYQYFENNICSLGQKIWLLHSFNRNLNTKRMTSQISPHPVIKFVIGPWALIGKQWRKVGGLFGTVGLTDHLR